MKLLFYSITMVILCLSCSSEKSTNTEDARLIYDLKDKVKSITCETFDIRDIKSDEVVKGEKNDTYSFSPFTDDFRGDNYTISFNFEGEVQNLKVFGTNGIILYAVSNSFDKYAQIKESEIISNSSKSKTIFERDDCGNPSKSKTFDEKNILICEMIYNYTESNKLIEITSLYPERSKIYNTKIDYIDGLKIQTHYNEKDSLILLLKTNKKGKIIEKISFENEKVLAKYDKDDFLKSFSVFIDSELSDFYEYYNDVNGNILVANHYKEDNLVDSYKFEYEYDIKKNWIKRIMFDNETPIFITERTIEYF